MTADDKTSAMLDEIVDQDVLGMLDRSPIDRRDSDDLVDAAEARGEVRRKKAIARRIAYHAQKTAQIANFTEIGLPADGEIITAITSGSFNAYSIVLHAIDQFGCLDRLSITTFNMHQNVIADVFHQFDAGAVKRLDIMLSESVSFRMPKRFEQMHHEFESRSATGRVRVKFNWNHSKIILMQAQGLNFCITGSGNLSDNAQFEQYHLSCNLAEFDFFSHWMDEQFSGEQTAREILL